MAHTCPDCGQLCHCKGDMEDCDYVIQPHGGCIHYKSNSCISEDDFDDEYDDYDSFLEDNNPNDSRNL